MGENQTINILFVDDEIKILNGLKRSLRPMRGRWNMSFALGGQEALTILDSKDMDIIISDMFMPEMDGAKFLQTVRDLYPHTIRAILSGHSDHNLTLKTIKQAHAFFHKPCPPQKITEWVNKVLFLRKLLPNKELQQETNGIGALPSQPLFFPLLLEELSREKMSGIGETIAYDVNMAANILKVTLNSFFAQPEKLPSLQDAAKMLGPDLLLEIISSKDIFAEHNESLYKNFSTDLLWRHCLRTAQYAQSIAALESKDPIFINTCYLAGLFHDIGKFLLLNSYRQAYLELFPNLIAQDKSLEQLEQARFNCTHGTAGAYLLGIWGLPLSIVEAVAFHHRPSALKKYTVSPLCIVHVADVLDHLFLRFTEDKPKQRLDTDFLQQTISKETLHSWKHACKNVYQKKQDELFYRIW